MKLMQVFDCQDMPMDIKLEFFSYCERNFDCGNDIYVHWYLDGGCDPVDSWLRQQSRNVQDEVLIKHWW
jgi:hypothetical protein